MTGQNIGQMIHYVKINKLKGLCKQWQNQYKFRTKAQFQLQFQTKLVCTPLAVSLKQYIFLFINMQ
jgi:hypothetical protein